MGPIPALLLGIVLGVFLGWGAVCLWVYLRLWRPYLYNNPSESKPHLWGVRAVRAFLYRVGGQKTV